MVVAIYGGTGKPKCEDFLKQFVAELIQLLNSGLILNNASIKVAVNAIICDTPARAFIKCKYNNSFLNIFMGQHHIPYSAGKLTGGHAGHIV